MNSTQWLKKTSIILLLILLTILLVNYIIDPYGIYNSNFFKFQKITQSEKMRFIKPLIVQNIKPKSIVLGTSRAEHGYSTDHKYFKKPTYNFGLTSASMYEATSNLKYAIKQGRLEQVLLVLDYRMFNDKNQKQVKDFEHYFDGSRGKYYYLYSLDTFKDTLRTIFKTYKPFFLYHKNGSIVHEFEMKKLKKLGSQLLSMSGYERNYYKLLKKEYIYKDTKKSSFKDFEELLELCYKNDIELDIIFGPSHIRQWEALAYYLGEETFSNWKRDIVKEVEKVAKKLHKKPYKIIDFAIYHKLTSEKMPSDKNQTMQYYYDSSHYNQKLGNLVLNSLIDKNRIKGFGVEISSKNIEQHLKHQKDIKKEFIDVSCYREEVFN